jgi:hypothetical protein
MYIDIDDADNKIYLKGFYLEGQLGSATEITLSVILFSTTTQTITIDSVTFDAENNQTIINTTESITAADGNYTLYTFYFDVDVFLPERLESFSKNFVTGVTDKFSEYNIDHAPSTFLIEWFNFLGSTLEAKDATKLVRFTNGVNNNELSRRYKSGFFYTTAQLAEDQNHTLLNMRLYRPPIFSQYEWELIAYIDYDTFLQIRKSLLGNSEASPSTDYGYLEFTDNFGNLVKIWPISMKRDQGTDRTEIVGWEKSGINAGNNYLLRESGEVLLRESGDYILRESAAF